MIHLSLKDINTISCQISWSNRPYIHFWISNIYPKSQLYLILYHANQTNTLSKSYQYFSIISPISEPYLINNNYQHCYNNFSPIYILSSYCPHNRYISVVSETYLRQANPANVSLKSSITPVSAPPLFIQFFTNPNH